MMSFGAHATDSVGDVGHILCWSADAEALKTSQLGYLKIGIRNLTLIREEDVDLPMALESSDGVY
jgi:hypothetical protein